MINSTVNLTSKQLKLITASLAFTTGAAVANLYYVQPILNEIRHDFHLSELEASLLVTFTQAGYAAGLLFLVPLGDIFKRKKLSTAIILASFCFLIIAHLSPDYYLFSTALFFIGLTSVVTHILVAYAADLAPQSKRGKVIAQVMSGLLMGILLSRAFSGIIASYFGWRSVYSISAILMGLSAVLILKVLPRENRDIKTSYLKLVFSAFMLLKESNTLRYRCLLGALTFGGFSVLWTTLTFLLSKPPYNFKPLTIGLFSAIGLGGIIAANISGRLSDRGFARLNTTLSGVFLFAGFFILLVFKDQLIGIIIGISLVDISTQGMQITNQSIIFQIDENSRSRINAIYMTGYFIGAAIFSALAGVLYNSWGWAASCGLGLALAIIVCIFAITDMFLRSIKLA